MSARTPSGSGDSRSLGHPLAWLPQEWGDWLDDTQARYRGEQIFRWLHFHREFRPEQMTNLNKVLRQRLASTQVELPVCVDAVHGPAEGTRKLVLSLEGGARIESVLIPMTRTTETDDADLGALEGPEAEEDLAATRVTLCVSTQFGCAMGCVFCASGRAGLVRGLSAAEIVAQVHVARAHLAPGEVLRNLVFMGMGEPLHHYAETARAIRVLTHPAGLDMSPRRITVSTVGLVPGIRRLGADFDGKIGLAVSLHAPNDELRSRIVPMNRRYPLPELMAALRAYPLPRRRRITIEYTLIHGVNDSCDAARELAGLLRGLPVKVNLIPMNDVDGLLWRASSGRQVEAFRGVLADHGYACFVRTRRGDDVSAACGQLAMQKTGAEGEASPVP